MPHNHEETSDAELIRRITLREGRDEAACAMFYERHRLRIFAHCMRIMNGNRADAEDGAQAAFDMILKGLGGFEKRSKLSTWAHRVTVRAVRGQHRKKRVRTIPISQTPASEGGDVFIIQPHGGDNSLMFEGHDQADIGAPERFSEAIASKELVDMALQQLAESAPETHKTIVARYFEDLEHGEVAQKLCCSIGTSKSNTHKGERRLLISLARMMNVNIRFGNAKLEEIRKILRPLIAHRILAR